MNVDLEELAAVIEQLDQAEFSELRFEKGDFRLHVRRGCAECAAPDGSVSLGSSQAAPAPVDPATAPPASGPAPTPAPAPRAVTATAAVETSAPTASVTPADTGATGPRLDPEDLPAGHVLVSAPMLGTFYSGPQPGAAPFVQVGDAVGPETTLCIIEVMKLMNSVPAGTSGEIAAVYLSDGDLAEFDQPLFAVKVSA